MVKELLRMGEKENILLIEKLITDDDFDKLKDYSKEVNVFKITGIELNEIRHSNTIAWLLNPFGNHNLGALFFQKFMSHLFEENHDYFNEKSINILELLLNDIDDIEVFREKEHIDILVVSQRIKFVLCIENKIKAGIGNNQLNNYYKIIKEQYPSPPFRQLFLLLWPSGDKVPVDKSENQEDWISASYEDIVKILRSILDLDIEQKVKYIIGDYIKLLEKEQIVENAELDGILSRLCTKHKDAIDLLLEYSKRSKESQPVGRVREIIKEILLEYEKEEKIVGIKEAASSLSFNTTNMNKYFPLDQDKPGSWKDGQKYKYWVILEEPDKTRMYLQVNLLGQDDDIKKKMELIRDKFNPTKNTSKEFNKIKHWYINIKWTHDSMEDLFKDERVQEMKAEIKKTLNEILQWEETEVKNILK
jgi:hypothetical protein